MSAARKTIPAAPASQVRAAESLSSLCARARRALPLVPAEALRSRDAASEHRMKPHEAGLGRDAAAVERTVAALLETRARELHEVAAEVAWYAAGCPFNEPRR